MAPNLITNATNNVTGMYTLFQYVNEVAPNFFILVLFGLLVILFVIFRSRADSNSKAFAASSFFIMILSILFRTMGFIDNKWMYISITVMAGAVVWLHLDSSPS